MKRMIVMLAAAGLLLAWAGEAQAAVPEAKCKVCHTLNKDGINKTGPNLFGVYGSKVGMKEGFHYSPVMKTHGWTWDEAHLREWVCDANKAAKKFSGDASAHVRMPAQHLCGNKADAIIAFLKTLK